VVIGDRSDGRSTDFVVTMVGTPAAADAAGWLTIFDIDDAGNWPMELTVHGLDPSPNGRPYELWLTNAGDPTALCGSFLTNADGSAVVPLNAPYEFTNFDGWVVVTEGSRSPLLTT